MSLIAAALEMDADLRINAGAPLISEYAPMEKLKKTRG